MNSDDVKRLRMWHEAASRAEELTPLTNREISDLLAAAEERDRLRRDAKVVLDGAIRASVDRDRALAAARELREALVRLVEWGGVGHAVDCSQVEDDGGEGCEGECLHDAIAEQVEAAFKSTAWLTDGGDNG
jgi:hypothetical protein